MALPPRVTVCEVGLRDGLQNEKGDFTTDDKLELVQALLAAGLTEIELASFVHPRLVPQMADAEAVLGRSPRPAGVRRRVLVPNLRGTERALACDLDELCYSVVTTETYNQKNWGASIAELLEQIRLSVARVRQDPRPLRLMGNIAASFGCPYEGDVPVEQVLRLTRAYVEMGFDGVQIADSTGMANPEQMKRVLTTLRAQFPDLAITLHLHNTRGLGLANAYAALELGFDRFDASIGGLGGCPFAPKATGNICTEDFVHMLHEMEIETGIDLDRLLAAAPVAERIVGHPLPGLVHRAGKRSDIAGRYS